MVGTGVLDGEGLGHRLPRSVGPIRLGSFISLPKVFEMQVSSRYFLPKLARGIDAKYSQIYVT